MFTEDIALPLRAKIITLVLGIQFRYNAFFFSLLSIGFTGFNRSQSFIRDEPIASVTNMSSDQVGGL